jgi:hypothetical protein
MRTAFSTDDISRSLEVDLGPVSHYHRITYAPTLKVAVWAFYLVIGHLLVHCGGSEKKVGFRFMFL